MPMPNKQTNIMPNGPHNNLNKAIPGQSVQNQEYKQEPSPTPAQPNPTRRTIPVRLPAGQYTIIIERGLLSRAGEEIRQVYRGKKIFIVTDSTVGPLYEETVRQSAEAAGYQAEILTIPAGEPSKSHETLLEVYNFLLDKGASRKDLLIALGGGVVGDLAGFAAATYMRGMPYVQVPTSLLAQIDSSIGGKVAVNLPRGKNLVGAFYQPALVLIDPDCLNTLAPRYLSDGAAEAVKYGCIRDPEIFKIMQNISNPQELLKNIDEIIYRSCVIKRDVVERDEKEQGERMILNFGHTIGHAIESYYEYRRYSHGESVAIGMACIADISEKYGYAPAGTGRKIREVLKKLNLPTDLDEPIHEALVERIYSDKKNSTEISNLILIKDIGQVFIKQLKTRELKEFFREGGFLQ